VLTGQIINFCRKIAKIGSILRNQSADDVLILILEHLSLKELFASRPDAASDTDDPTPHSL
jgi:hypothetical protein